MLRDQPAVTCIMPTADRRRFVPQAVAQFLQQDHAESELLVLDDGVQSVEDLMPENPRVRYVREERRSPIGVKRNRLCELARGDVIVHWDDDDWAAPWRVRYQVERLLAEGADVCGLARPLFYDPAEDRAWQYVYPQNAAPWVYGATLCYTKAFWRRNPFPPIGVGEDSRFVWANVSKKLLALEDERFFVAMIHAGNTSRKQTRGQRWRPMAAGIVRELIGAVPGQEDSHATNVQPLRSNGPGSNGPGSNGPRSSVPQCVDDHDRHGAGDRGLVRDQCAITAQCGPCRS